MKAFYFNKNSGWTQAETLREALSHTHRAGLRPEDTPFAPRPEGAPFVLCLAGAGGKTSYLKQLAWEGKAAGLGPAVITTTHIYRPSSFAALDCGPEAVEKMIREQGMAVAGHLEESGKISFMGWEWYEGDAGAGRAGDSARYRPHFMHSGTVCPGKAPGGCVLSP